MISQSSFIRPPPSLRTPLARGREPTATPSPDPTPPLREGETLPPYPPLQILPPPPARARFRGYSEPINDGTTIIPDAPPLATTLCPDRGTAEPSCTPLARAVCSPSTLACSMPQPLHPVGPLPVPKHARTHVHPSHPSHRGCTRLRSGPATPWVVRDDIWLYQYVLIESVSTVPSSSLPAAVLASVSRVGRADPRAPAPSHRHPLP